MAIISIQYKTSEQREQIFTEQEVLGNEFIGEKNHLRGEFTGNWLLFDDAPREPEQTEMEKIKADLEALTIVLKDKTGATDEEIEAAKNNMRIS